MATDWKKYYQANRDKRMALSRLLYQKKKKQIKAAKKLKWESLTDKQKEKIRNQRRNYYLANKEKYLVRSAKQYKKFTNLIKKLKREVKKLKGE